MRSAPGLAQTANESQRSIRLRGRFVIWMHMGSMCIVLANCIVTVSTVLPEVTVNGLALWRLRLSSDRQLWCAVRDSTDVGELVLTVCDPAADWAISWEVHANIGQLIDRSESLRDQLVADGWQAVDVDLDEPD